MGTVRQSAKITFTIIVIVAASIIIHRYYIASDYDYFDMVKAFMLTKNEIGSFHSLLIKLGFFLLLFAGVSNSVVTSKSGIYMFSTFWIPVVIMCVLAILFIPNIGFTNIHLFWFVCYILVTVGTFLSARKTTKFCKDSSNLLEVIKKNDNNLAITIDRTDFLVAFITAACSYVIFGLLFVGALLFGINNWKLISGDDDVMPIVSSIRYQAAIELMDDGDYEKAMNEFRQLGDFDNSQEMYAACEDELYFPTYQEAIRLLGQGKYDEARNRFSRIYSYKDSSDRIKQCDDLQYGPQYSEALALLDNGLFEDALDIFESLRNVGYKNVSNEIERCKSGMKTSLSGTWYGGQGSLLTLREDMTCSYVDGGGPSGEGEWDVVDNRLIVHTSALSYDIYGDLDNGYKTTSVLIKADSSNWRDETFTKG